MNNYACYPHMTTDAVKSLLPYFCQSNSQCAGRHQAGRCNCGLGTEAHPELSCCRIQYGDEKDKLIPFCGENNDNEAALILLDAICGMADAGHGGGYCAGDFNWGPAGVKEKTISQVDACLDDSWPGQPCINVAYGLNCAVVPEAGGNVCKYNRNAAVNAGGDIVYKNFVWNAEDADYCKSLQESDCQKVADSFGLCAWKNDGCVGDRKSISVDPSKVGVPVCMSRGNFAFDCAEADGSYCHLFPNDPQQKSVGRCFQGDCRDFSGGGP